MESRPESEPEGRADGASGQEGAPQQEAPLLIMPEMLAPAEQRDSRIDFERGMSYFPRATLALIVICTAVFIWELCSGALENQQSIVAAGALHRQSVLRGQWWRLLSAMFLHGGFDHLFGNCIVLYIVGMACEHAFGLKRAAVAYLYSGLCGAVLSMACSPGPSVGASGAIFGVVGCVVVFFYRHQGAIVLRDKRIGFVLLVWALYQIGCGFFTPLIDNFAHIGGFIGGCLAALFLKPALLERVAGAAG